MLVQHVYEHRDVPINGIYYSELATRIGRLTKHGVGNGHGMGRILGKMGHLLESIEDGWGEEIPHIQSLVIIKQGGNRNLPDDGIREFWPDYPRLTKAEKLNRVLIEYERIKRFGSRWDDALDKLNLERVANSPAPTEMPLPHVSAGESMRHKEFKKYVRLHPELVGASDHWQTFVEFPLPSLDIVDVVFLCRDECIAVEVKSSISDAFPRDYERGLFQTVKYAAILSAMSHLPEYRIPQKITVLLVLESALPAAFRPLAETLAAKVIENARN